MPNLKSQMALALPLFVARVFANHAHDVFAFHDLARLALAFDGGSDFHFRLFKICLIFVDRCCRPFRRTKNRAGKAAFPARLKASRFSQLTFV
jgi:hypothetical protein